jgi:hypothetical protein
MLYHSTKIATPSVSHLRLGTQAPSWQLDECVNEIYSFLNSATPVPRVIPLACFQYSPDTPRDNEFSVYPVSAKAQLKTKEALPPSVADLDRKQKINRRLFVNKQQTLLLVLAGNSFDTEIMESAPTPSSPQLSFLSRLSSSPSSSSRSFVYREGLETPTIPDPEALDPLPSTVSSAPVPAPEEPPVRVVANVGHMMNPFIQLGTVSKLRSWFFVASVNHQQLEVFSYNLHSGIVDQCSKIITNLSNLVYLRQHLMTNLSHQKMGLYYLTTPVLESGGGTVVSSSGTGTGIAGQNMSTTGVSGVSGIGSIGGIGGGGGGTTGGRGQVRQRQIQVKFSLDNIVPLCDGTWNARDGINEDTLSSLPNQQPNKSGTAMDLRGKTPQVFIPLFFFFFFLLFFLFSLYLSLANCPNEASKRKNRSCCCCNDYCQCTSDSL